jgi:methyl-accepting chemotaxis protein
VNNLSFKMKIMLSLIVVGVISTTGSIFIAYKNIGHSMRADLTEKSQAILSRVEQSSHYVAEMNTLKGIIDETKKNFPDGQISEEQKLKILRSVPIYAAFKIGQEGSEKENYKFRIASDAPRNKDNQATKDEIDALNKFRANPGLTELVYESPDGENLMVSVPVRISEKRNCLLCHGHPSTSPWGNGKDILGYRMEDLKDGDIRATFTIISKLSTLHKEQSETTRELILVGVFCTLFASLIGYFGINGPLKTLAKFATDVSHSSQDLKITSDELGSASQQLASSSQEQASSVEETSSSLEEISGTVMSALKGAQSSLELTKKVSELVQQGTDSMNDLHKSVDQIAEANARVEKLVKLIEEIGEKTELIDEIVFQTRLLSFNASVEAERAGEHGRGFAVVAQEVGNLAQMSGKSAGEIGQIVKASIKEAQEVASVNRVKVERGVTLCKVTSDHLKSIEMASKEILTLSEQIVRTSEEQNSGVRQINQAIQLISQATQENASAAEQISGGSLNVVNQSNTLSNIVVELERLIKGGAPSQNPSASASSDKPVKIAKSPLQTGAKRGIKVNRHHQATVKDEVPSNSKPNSEDPWDKI